MFLEGIVSLIIVVVSYILIILWCGKIATQKNRDPFLWRGLACFFHFFALIVLFLLPYRTNFKPINLKELKIIQKTGQNSNRKDERRKRIMRFISNKYEKIIVALAGLAVAYVLVFPPRYYQSQGVRYTPIPDNLMLYYSRDWTTAILRALAILVVAAVLIFLLRNKSNRSAGYGSPN